MQKLKFVTQHLTYIDPGMIGSMQLQRELKNQILYVTIECISQSRKKTVQLTNNLFSLQLIKMHVNSKQLICITISFIQIVKIFKTYLMISNLKKFVAKHN